jgi:hypothetical protein
VQTIPVKRFRDSLKMVSIESNLGEEFIIFKSNTLLFSKAATFDKIVSLDKHGRITENIFKHSREHSGTKRSVASGRLSRRRGISDKNVMTRGND